jgi:TolB protein
VDTESGLLPLTSHPGDDRGGVWSPDGGMIAWVSDRLGNWTIWVMHSDGSGKRQLTPEEVTSGWPSWSPDGTRLAYWSYDGERSDVWMVDLKTDERVNLTHDEEYEGLVSWSPDSDLVAYDSNKTGIWHIRLLNATSGEQQALTMHEFDHFLTGWRPDGKTVVYWGMDTNTWEVRVDSGFQRRITSGSNFEITAVYSPAMETMVYLHFSNDVYRLWIMDPDGSDQRWPSRRAGTKGDRQASFHPCLDLVLFWGYRVFARADAAFSSVNTDIYVSNLETGNTTRLTVLESEDMYPSWKPDGTSILFESDRRGNLDLFVMSFKAPEKTFRIINVDFRPTVEMDSELELRVDILYGFEDITEVVLEVVDLDSEDIVTTKRLQLQGYDSTTLTISVPPRDQQGVWRFRVEAWYLRNGTELHDDEGWFKQLSLEVIPEFEGLNLSGFAVLMAVVSLSVYCGRRRIVPSPVITRIPEKSLRK